MFILSFSPFVSCKIEGSETESHTKCKHDIPLPLQCTGRAREDEYYQVVPHSTRTVSIANDGIHSFKIWN